MRALRKVLIIALFAALPATQALADDPNYCTEECPDGKVKVSFSDGNKATCVCVEPGPGMQETVPEVVEFPAEGTS